MITSLRVSALLACVALAACASTGEHRSAGSAPQEHDPPAPQVGYDGGLYARSADGDAEVVLEGLFQTVFGYHGSERDPESDVTLKRMRPELAGRFQGLRFRLEPKFTEDEVELEEAWVGTEVGSEGILMFGRMKAPFNLEEVRSRRHIDFPGFSIVNQFAPAEDHGVFYNGRSASGTWEYGLAAYNGTGGADTGSSKDVAARLMVHPFAGDAGATFENLQLGVAATLGSQDDEVEGGIEGPAGFDVVRFAPGAALDGGRERLGLEAAWYRGPWMALAEYVTVDQEMAAAGGGEGDIAFHGGYLTVSRVLTGESKSFGGVRPDVPFDFESGAGRGAWVLALRLSRLELDDDLETLGLVEEGTFTDAIEGLSLGLNWIPNDHAIVRHSLILSRFDDEVQLDRGVDDEELAFLIEVQLHF